MRARSRCASPWSQVRRLYRIKKAQNKDLVADVHTGTESGRGSTGGSFRFLPEDLTADSTREHLQATYSGLVRLISQKGPFDGVMGFSEGGAVAAGLLLLDASQGFAGFRCGVFFCAATPLDPQMALAGERRAMSARADGFVVRVPTAHVWSSGGEVHPDMGRELSSLCESGPGGASGGLREELVHDLGHNVPGSVSGAFLQGTVRAVERTIERAKTFQG